MFSRERRCLLLSLILFTVTVDARPFSVSTEITIHSVDWYPLPLEDMKAATADTELSELTKGGS